MASVAPLAIHPSRSPFTSISIALLKSTADLVPCETQSPVVCRSEYAFLSNFRTLLKGVDNLPLPLSAIFLAPSLK